MSNTGSVRETRDVSGGRGRALNIALWALQALLALVFAMAGLSKKVFGDGAMVEMFSTISIGQWFRYVVGALELAAALGLLIPRFSGLAALGLVGIMAGAIFTNLFVLDRSPLLPLAIVALSIPVAWGRWSKTGPLLGKVGR